MGSGFSPMKGLRYSVYLLLCISYLVPLLIFSTHIQLHATLLIYFILWALTSIFSLGYLIFLWEKRMRQKVALMVLDKAKRIKLKTMEVIENVQQLPINPERVIELSKEMEDQQKKREELTKEVQRLTTLNKDWEKELVSVKQDLQQQVEKKESLLSEYRNTCSEQRLIIEKKQEDIRTLKLRVNDLTHELSSLLKIKDPNYEIDNIPFSKEGDILLSSISRSFESRSSSRNNYENSSQQQVLPLVEQKLQRYIAIASELTGVNHLSGRGFTFSEFSLGSLVIDQRRLFELLQNEEEATVFVYSPKEGKLIFINRIVKDLLGWTSEKFVKNFPTLIQMGLAEWTKAINELKRGGQQNIPLIIKTKSGKDLLVHCSLGLIPQGNFQGLVIGVLSES